MRHMLAALCALAALLPLPLAAACPTVPEVAGLAAAILERRTPPPPRTDLSMADALCARERLVAVLAQPFGDQVGWKVGLTNPAAQQRFGVPHPVAGAIFHGTLRERSGAELPARFGIVPAVESDLLVRIRDEGVNEAGDDPVALLRHIEAVIPFIELPDLVYGGNAPWSGPLLLSINVGARLGVLGEEIPAEATPDFAARLASMTVTLRESMTGAPSHDTRELSRASGSALLGHPLNALAWLVRDLREHGRRLRAGDYVSLGGFSPALPAEAGRRYTATYEGLAAAPVSVDVRLR
jgi:2-keto-4-pentenoate hydratase